LNKETKPEKRETHPVEKYPKKDTIRELGKTAIKGASKDKPKK
jgi:hypothetical protein